MKEKIGNCFPYIKNGLNIKQDKNKGGIPITRIETLSNDRFNRDKMGYADIFDVEKYSDRILCDGDILMSHINSSRYLGRAVLYQKQNNENIIHGVNLLRLKADRSIVYPNYAAKFFASRYFKKQVVSITKKAVNQASFSIAALKELEIQLPDLDTQKRIAQNFEKISNCIFTLEEYLNKLDDLVKSRFVEMFGTASDKRCVFLPTEEVCEVVVDCPHETPKYQGDLKYPAIRTSELVGTTICWDTMKYVSEDEYQKRTRRLKPRPGDVVYAREGTYGNAAVLPKGKSFCLGQRIMLFRVDSTVCLPEFFLYALTSTDVRKQADELNVGTTVPHVNVRDAKKFLIPIPPLSLQREFADFVTQVDKLKFDFDFLVSFSIPSICLFCLKLDP